MPTKVIAYAESDTSIAGENHTFVERNIIERLRWIPVFFQQRIQKVLEIIDKNSL